MEKGDLVKLTKDYDAWFDKGDIVMFTGEVDNNFYKFQDIDDSDYICLLKTGDFFPYETPSHQTLYTAFQELSEMVEKLSKIVIDTNDEIYTEDGKYAKECINKNRELVKYFE